MKTLKDWYEQNLEVLKAKNLHLKQEYITPLYIFYLLKKTEYGDLYIKDDWNSEYKEYLEKNYK
jgi:hypothetical protein